MGTEPSKPTLPARINTLTAWMPLLWISLTFAAGILFASLFSMPAPAWWSLAGGFLVVFIILLLLSRQFPARIPRLLLFYLAFLVIFSLGAARYQSSIPKVDAAHIAWYNDREYEVLVTGTIIAPPDARDSYTNLRIQVSSIDTGDEILPVGGLLLARVPAAGKWHYGDVVRLRGHLETPPEAEEFSYRDYLARQGVLATLSSATVTRLPFTGGSPILRSVYWVKEQVYNRIFLLFQEPEASLLAGILLGEDNRLPADLKQAYQDTGTAHIIAISGFNIAILAGLFIFIFGRLLGQRRGAVAAAAGIILYVVLVGASPSVQRAAFMGTLGLLARQIGRRQNGLNSLAFAAAFLAFFDPQILWDVGFQLSFSATLGLILYAQPLLDWFTALLARRFSPQAALRIAIPVSEFMFFTLAAQLTTLPITAYHFGRISLMALAANPFILPVQPAVMVLSGLAVLLSFIFLPLGKLIAWAAWPFAAYTNRAVEFFARLPHGVIDLGRFPLFFVLLLYLVLFILTFRKIRLAGALRPILTPAFVLSTLGVATFLVWSAAFRAPDGRLHLVFLDMGTADAMLIQTPTGRAVLINGGPSPSGLAGALGLRISTFDRSLDWLVVASPQEQQLASLPDLLDRFPVRNVLWSGNPEASRSARDLDRSLAARNIAITRLYPGAVLDLGSGARLEALAVSARGAVLLLEWNSFRALLPVGMDLTALEELDFGKRIGRVSVLLLADSGYAPLNPPKWLASLQPQVAVLSVSAGDPSGLPDQSVLDSLAGRNLLRTDRSGWIEISTDGENMTVDVERK